ncbi:hypothetical protein ACE6H2_010964 [Prunus campanulata]
MVHDVCELLWLCMLFTKLGFAPKPAMTLFCDDKATMNVAHNPVQHDHTKNAEVDRHFIKEKLEAELVTMPFVNSENQLADILTKTVSSKVYYDSLDKLGIGGIYSPT